VRRARLVLVATSLAAFTATLDNTVVAVALHSMQQDLKAGVTGLQGVVTAYTVALAALLLAGGALVDVLGAKRVLLGGLAVFAGASAGCASAGSVDALVTWRAVQGTGAALLLPGGLAVLAAAYPDQALRRRAVGIWAATGGTALVAGPVVGGLLVSAQGWQSVFWVNVPLSALVAAVVVPTPEVTPKHVRRLDVAGAVLTCSTLGLATWAVVLAGRNGLSTQVLLTLAGTALSAVLLVVLEGRSHDPLLPGQLMRDRRFGGAALGAFGASLAVFILLVFVSLFLQLVQTSSAREAGLVLLPLPLALVVTAPLAGRARAVVAPVVLGLLIAGGGLLALGLTLNSGTSHRSLEVLLAVVGAGVGLTTAPVVTVALATAGQARAGLAAASINVARELGGVVAVAGLGALAVSRLTQKLTEVLVTAGVPGDKQPALLDALLSAREDDVRQLFVHAVSVAQVLKFGAGVRDSAKSSFVGSTQLILQASGFALLVLALVCGWLLRPRHDGSSAEPQHQGAADQQIS
jgi:DHA2 family methylenomycin A resistance protein-like MFS transporter